MDSSEFQISISDTYDTTAQRMMNLVFAAQIRVIYARALTEILEIAHNLLVMGEEVVVHIY
jgi:hypothetical protein